MAALSRREEETLLKTTKERAMKEYCSPLVQEFAECATGRTVSVAWACRRKWNAVQECMAQYTGPEAMDVVQKEYLRLRNQHESNPPS